VIASTMTFLEVKATTVAPFVMVLRNTFFPVIE
jgi:hypothetical protein